MIFLALEGKMETKLNNAMNFFGFNHRSEFARDEFHYYLDCLFRGIMKFAIPAGSSKPIMAGKSVRQEDIEDLVSQVFPSGVDVIDREQFISQVFKKRQFYALLDYFQQTFEESLKACRKKLIERLQITQLVRRLMLDMQKAVYAEIKVIEEKKAKGEYEGKGKGAAQESLPYQNQ